MKNLIIIFLAIFGISFLSSCEKELKDPVLDKNQTVVPAITAPADGAAFTLIKDEADSLMTTFEWSPAQYNLTNIETTKYMLQMDLSGNNFADPYTLVSTQETSFSITEGSMNNILLSVLELSADEEQVFEIRVRSFVNDISPYSSVYSAVKTIKITPYSDEIYIKPIYLLGGSTTVAWDNTIALPMQYIGNGQFARVEALSQTGDNWIKFISILGAWTPQWGTDATGTLESGPLVYRPDDPTTDPPAIPFTGVDGNYYIMADTLNLAYETFLTSGELFLVGDATTAGWDAGAALAFTESSPHIFTIVTTLNATGAMKFLEVKGAWAPQWGTNDQGNNKKGLLVYRPKESVPDPPSIPAPSTAGSYLITVDLTTMHYSVEAQ